MARKSSNPRYQGEREYRLVPLDGRVEHRVMVWYSPQKGKPKDVAVSYQVSVRGGDWMEIVRYDSCHGHFHRHKAHYGEPMAIDHSFGNLPMLERKDAALDDIGRNAGRWHNLIPLEVLD